jgi:hypothetical protein
VLAKLVSHDECGAVTCLPRVWLGGDNGARGRGDAGTLGDVGTFGDVSSTPSFFFFRLPSTVSYFPDQGGAAFFLDSMSFS